jgi:hypothetical protein
LVPSLHSLQLYLPHDGFCVLDLGSAATMTMVTTSGGVLFHNSTTHHDWFHVHILQNCTAPHDGFRVDLGSVATMTNVTTSGVLFHNRSALIMILSKLILALLLVCIAISWKFKQQENVRLLSAFVKLTFV